MADKYGNNGKIIRPIVTGRGILQAATGVGPYSSVPPISFPVFVEVSPGIFETTKWYNENNHDLEYPISPNGFWQWNYNIWPSLGISTYSIISAYSGSCLAEVELLDKDANALSTYSLSADVEKVLLGDSTLSNVVETAGENVWSFNAIRARITLTGSAVINGTSATIYLYDNLAVRI